jgi:GNAT superfamily N-acetyltransferase
VTTRTDSPAAAAATYVVREVSDLREVAEVRRLVLSHADSRVTTPGVEYMRADALAMPGPYVAPAGALWLASSGDMGIGCVALRPLTGELAEVKRMFVDSAWRGRGVGRALLQALIAGARRRAYARLRLGTLADMTAAHSLYRSVGFLPIERYRPDEMVDTHFYEMELR